MHHTISSSNKISRIYLIEDDIDDCEIFEEALKAIDPAIGLVFGYEFQCEFDQLHQFDPQLIFLDLNLPKKHGFEFLREIKESSALMNIPVIMYSSFSGASYTCTALQLGARMYFEKPDSFEVLARGLKEILSMDWNNPGNLTPGLVKNGTITPMSSQEFIS